MNARTGKLINRVAKTNRERRAMKREWNRIPKDIKAKLRVALQKALVAREKRMAAAIEEGMTNA